MSMGMDSAVNNARDTSTSSGVSASHRTRRRLLAVVIAFFGLRVKHLQPRGAEALELRHSLLETRQAHHRRRKRRRSQKDGVPQCGDVLRRAGCYEWWSMWICDG